jgi:uncharacterized protein (DUF1015 family)
MSVLLPFRALYYPNPVDWLFVPGEETDPPFHPELLAQDTQPCLFIYRQRFQNLIREGVIGLLDRGEATVCLHEETCANSVAACSHRLRETGVQTSTLWAWVNDADRSLASLLVLHQHPVIEAADRFGCLHQIVRVANTTVISQIQTALQGKTLFLADGHHRFASGWTLITIQVRSNALSSRAGRLPQPPNIDDLEEAALGGRLLPPKSTDFFPKLAAGLVMARHPG